MGNKSISQGVKPRALLLAPKTRQVRQVRQVQSNSLDTALNQGSYVISAELPDKKASNSCSAALPRGWAGTDISLLATRFSLTQARQGPTKKHKPRLLEFDGVPCQLAVRGRSALWLLLHGVGIGIVLLKGIGDAKGDDGH